MKDKDGETELDVLARSLAFALKGLGAVLMYFKQMIFIKIYFR